MKDGQRHTIRIQVFLVGAIVLGSLVGIGIVRFMQSPSGDGGVAAAKLRTASSAQEVADQVRDAYRHIEGIRGWESIAYDYDLASEAKFTYLSNGNLALDLSGQRSYYDASTNALISCGEPCTQITGVNNGDIGTVFTYSWSNDVVHGLLNDSSARLTEEMYDGRPVWRLVYASTDEAGSGLRQGLQTVLVDREHAVIVSTDRRDEAGAVVFSAEIHDLEVNPKVDPSEFTRPQSGVPVSISDGGAVTTDFDGAHEIVGYAPFQIRQLPTGFVRTSMKAASTLPSIANVRWRDESNSVTTIYRSGLAAVYVHSQQLTRSDQTPFDLGTNDNFEQPLESTDVVLTGGALREVTMHLVTTNRSVRLWGERSNGHIDQS